MSVVQLSCNERFVLRERLGTGGTGSVYRAFDNSRGAEVALKVLAHIDPSSLYRFKSEFRSITDLVHPNLVQLYDLVARDSEWLLTMELVEGSDFLDYVRPTNVAGSADSKGAANPLADELDDSTAHFGQSTNELLWPSDVLSPVELSGSSTGSTRGQSLVPAASGELDVEKLRVALRQLAEGLAALHRANRLHRDLKPANVLVFARDGRLVICDFGLVTVGTNVLGASESERGVGIAGTLAYMSPEQLTGQVLSEASDWYAVGVMLYRALTGVLPFSVRLSLPDAIAAKAEGKLLHPSQVAAEAPADLGDLALSLLDPQPARRPRHADVIALLDGQRRRISTGPRARPELIGRAAQLAQLEAAFRRASAGGATVALVTGRSGMGKSALVQHFLEQVEKRSNAVVLRGRCYEREELPFKAFDPVLDALSSYLITLDESSVRELLPPHVASLARLFPVLRRVDAVAEELVRSRGEVVDPLEQKRRAFRAFRELCRNIALRRPLVLYIDDLHWGDLDSGQLFGELLHAPQPPPLLLVCAHRSEDEASSALLCALRQTHLPECGITPVEVRIDALGERESRELARTLLADAEQAERAAAFVAEEAGGSPFFVRELALHVRAHPASAEHTLSLEAIIARRFETLSADGRRLFSLIATAARPEKRSVILAAAQLGAHGYAALHVLEARNFVHSTGASDEDRVEAYHDRLRETAYKRLEEAERRQLHRELAQALEQQPEPDVEALHEHWQRAGEPRKAGEYALTAARIAETQLAFERAAQLYRAALALLPLDAAQTRALEERLGHCLALAGRGGEAAEAFARALAGASPAQAMQLRSLVTTQLLRAGRIAQAWEELKRAKKLIGLAVPSSNARAVLMLLWRRLKIRASKLRLRAGDESASPELLQRADMLWGVGASLVGMDHLRGSVYQAEHLLVALQANEPYRLARALAVEASLSAANNQRPARTQLLIDRGIEIGGMSGEPHALSVVKGTAGVCRLLEGRFREAVRLTREAQEIIRERLNATLAWDLVTMVIFDLQATAYLGQVAEIVERVPEALRDAEARGDLYAATSCRTRRCIWAWLGPDRVEEARRQLATAREQWVQEGYHLQHWYMTLAAAEIDLYAGTPSASLARVAEEWGELVFLRRIQFTRIEIWNTRARLSLSAAHQSFAPRLLAAARADARSLRREGTHWGNALAGLLEACAASFEDRDLTLSQLARLEGQFDALDMQLHREVVRYRRGQLLGGDVGGALRERADGAMRALGVARPLAFCALLAPGFPDAAQEAEGALA